MTTIPALNNVSDILDTDMVMITHSNGDSYKISGADINKRNQAVIASSTTLTGAPLKTGNIVRAYFTVDLTAANGSTPLMLTYNNVAYNVKVPKNGTLASFLPFDLGGGVYKYLQAYTTLDLLYDGTLFVAIENQVLISNADYSIYTDGSIEYTKSKVDSLTNNRVTYEFRSGTDDDLPTEYASGNHFLVTFYYAYQTAQLAIASMSNNYSEWAPPTVLLVRVIDPNSGNWTAWRLIG